MTRQPLYKDIIQYINSQIESKTWLPGDRLPSEMQLAQQFGVSRITAKRAYDELHSQGIVRRRQGSGSFVADAAPQANRVADGTRKAIVSLVIPESASAVHVMDAVRQASTVLKDQGFFLSVHTVSQETGGERETLQALPQQRVAGVLYYPTNSDRDHDALFNCILEELPLVLLDKTVTGVPLPAVTSDNIAGGYLAASHLVEPGHSHIAFYAANPLASRTSVLDRFYGYCQALHEAGIAYNPAWVHPDPAQSSTAETKKALTHWIESGVTAVQADSDSTAAMLIRCLDELAIPIPQAVSLVGFDDLPEAEYLGLTSVSQDFAAIGAQATTLLLQAMRQPGKTLACLRTGVSLHRRQSTGPPPSRIAWPSLQKGG